MRILPVRGRSHYHERLPDGQYGHLVRAEDAGRTVDYTPPPWAAKLPTKDFGRAIRRVTGGEWWLEHEGTVDDLDDPEFARDELIRITFGYWDYLKNHWEAGQSPGRSIWSTCPTATPSAKLAGSWATTCSLRATCSGLSCSPTAFLMGVELDIHHPRGIYSGAEGALRLHPRVPIYSIPYRCLYSVNKSTTCSSPDARERNPMWPWDRCVCRAPWPPSARPPEPRPPCA